MKVAQSEFLSKKIVKFYENQGKKSKSKTVKHFMQEGINPSTVYRILHRYEVRHSTILLPRGGHRRTINTASFLSKIENHFLNNPNASVRHSAQKLGIAKSTLSYAKVHLLGLHAYAKQPFPKYRDGQEQRAKSNCGRIRRKARGRIFIMDDETYVHADPQQIPGKAFYHAASRNGVPPQARVKLTEKFSKKFLVWQCLDSLGNVSKPLVTTETMDGTKYKACLRKYLIPFIKKYHQQNKILFWPDMASCHYRVDVVQFLKQRKIAFVDRVSNAPNVPQVRPIERFWALCKAKMKRYKTPIRTTRSLSNRWGKVSKEVGRASGRKLMFGLKKKLALMERDGVYSVQK